ncbi:unnamed protein product, partial [Callosobruchus maculatus]
RSLAFLGVRLFNLIPLSIQNLGSIALFKKKLVYPLIFCSSIVFHCLSGVYISRKLVYSYLGNLP